MARAPFTYDGVNHTHGHLPSTPGSAAIPTSVDTTGLTALHEFGHASSDFNNGQVIDLYVDGLRPGFLLNKKARAQATDPVPASFATYKAPRRRPTRVVTPSAIRRRGPRTTRNWPVDWRIEVSWTCRCWEVAGQDAEAP